jgi:hypothetical protein
MKARHVTIAFVLALFSMAALPCLLHDSAVAQVVIKPTVFTVDATSITETTATLNGNLTDLGTSDNVVMSFEWGTTLGGPYPNQTTSQAMTTTGSFSASLSGLVPNNAYYFRAKAVGEQTSYGDDKAFFTTAAGLPTITTSDATSITATTATLNGNLTSTGISENVTVRFQWGTSTGYGFFTDTQIMTATGTFNASLSSLSPDTTYHFRAAAYGDGTSYGDDKTFTTKAGSVSLTVTTDDATEVTQTEATLNGTLTDLGTVAKVTVSFEWGETTSYGTGTNPKTMTATGSFSTSLSDLSPGTTYHFRTKAVAGETIYGMDKTLTTKSGPPSITTFAATNITDDSAILNGNMTTLGTATSVKTSFEWGTEKGGPYPNETTPEATTAAGNFLSNLTNLKPNTTYYFRAKADGQGTSYGSELSFKTEPETLQPPASEEDNAALGNLNWPLIAGAAIGATLLIILLVTVTRPRKLPAGATTPQGGIQQQTPGAQQPYGCPTCGAAIFFGTNPCPNCGTPLNWGSQQTATCPTCGAAIPFGANPCPNCGTGLNWHT